MDKSLLKDTMGRPLTQGLFLETKYDVRYAVFTMDGEDKEYKGKTYISLKKLYLEMMDPVEYTFATTHLLGWDHWMRLNDNKLLGPEFTKWRFELELKIRSEATGNIIEDSASEKGFQASKWLADRGWEKRGAGRPSKSDVQREKAIQANIIDEYAEDFKRLN